MRRVQLDIRAIPFAFDVRHLLDKPANLVGGSSVKHERLTFACIDQITKKPPGSGAY